MSFITKRERVFNEYDLFDLPARNEGKLKAYSSCTDARAWSHFCSDKTEHLVEIIKKNNDTCRPKYIPTNVIVDTLMVAKNTEIARLKRKIEEFEQMLAAYDQLELSCDQKCEIANAHAAIKAANKELDELCLDLDLSGFTEGIDSEAFETGKSRGDEPSKYRNNDETVSSRGTEEWLDEREHHMKKMETKSNQMGMSSPRDASTSARDERIEEMKDSIIAKDAKLSAMQNTIAVMENDVCEPYCIYAHIYTALEKIFGTLCQNDKYKQYLNLLTAGKDTRCIDIKGKILFKLKVLEKFSLALIAPCSQDFTSADCACYRAELVTHVETTFALTSADTKLPSLDNKRAHLVADIMENDEMREILNKKNDPLKDDIPTDVDFYTDNYTIDEENLKRLKNLQISYDDLMTCYEAMKHEKNCLQVRCHKYEGLEQELEDLRCQLREYNSLWNEKEHHRKRSMDLDTLKEQYLVLSDEASNLETQLKAESEINILKSKVIDELRNDNILLEKKLNDTIISFEKEKNNLQCKLKETECKVMCQEQQIKSLSVQIDRLLEEDNHKVSLFHPESKDIGLIDQNEGFKEQIKNLKDALLCNEEEKQNLQEEFQDKLKIINDLRIEIEDWKSTYEKTLQRNNYLENYTESFKVEAQKLMEENRNLIQDIDEKNTAIANLMNVINNKSQEINNLLERIEHKDSDKNNLVKQLQDLREKFKSSTDILRRENIEKTASLQLARQESHELLKKVKDYDNLIHQNDDISKTLETQIEDYNKLKNVLLNTIEENKSLQTNLANHENNNSILLKEIQRLREVNKNSLNNLSILEEEKNKFRASYDLTKKESQVLAEKLVDFEYLKDELEYLRSNYDKIVDEKQLLQNELVNNKYQLNNAIHSVEIARKESEELKEIINGTEKLKEDILYKANLDYQNLFEETQHLRIEISEKYKKIEMLQQDLNCLKIENENLIKLSENETVLGQQLTELKKAYEDLKSEKETLKIDFDSKTEELNNLYNALENKIEENRGLENKIKILKHNQLTSTSNIKTLQTEKLAVQSSLDAIKKESTELIDKLRQYAHLNKEFEQLKKDYEALIKEKESLQKDLNINIMTLTKENNELQSLNQTLLMHKEDLETALINTRTQDTIKPECIEKEYKYMKAEIDGMKKEKTRSVNKIRELLDKLDEMENIIAKRCEDILARDDKIAILQNHINELEEEVKKLHVCLAEVVNTGEQIKKHSYEKIDQSLKKMEAHHSKATHNMKMELCNLHCKNMKLQEQLSVTKLKTEENLNGQNKYISQINSLKNEREIIVDNIRQLELNNLEDSSLASSNCNLKDIITSLNRIGVYINDKCSKSTSLEQTLLKMQTSSQLLLSKADEAKKLVEKEQQKIINEKEEAIRDRVNMEKQLENLKKTLQQKISQDQDIITDLKAEISNKDLIIDKINKTTQNYISTLQTEMQTLQELYKKSTAKITELQEKIKHMSKDKNNDVEVMKKCKIALEKKSEEIYHLQNELEVLKNKSLSNVGIQTVHNQLQKNIATQTEAYSTYTEYERLGIKDKNIENVDISKHSLVLTEKTKLPKQIISPVSEVQVLTANIEPTFDYVKSSYLNYKMKRLTPGRLEQYSISSLWNKSENEFTPSSDLSTQIFSYDSPTVHNDLVDIYTRLSINTNSSKCMGNEMHTDVPNNNIAQTSAFNELETIRNGVEDKNIILKKRKNSEIIAEPTSNKSADNDLFVIYRDSESSNTPGMPLRRGSTGKKNLSELLVEAVSVQPTEGKIYETHNKDYMQSNSFDYDDNEDDSVKYKLNINLPRVQNDSPSVIESSEDDKKSLDSYHLSIYPSPRIVSNSTTNFKNGFDNVRDSPSLPTISSNGCLKIEYDDSQRESLDSETSRTATKKQSKHLYSDGAKLPKNIITSPPHKIYSNIQRMRGYESNKRAITNESESHHKLSRVGAEVLLIKSEDNYKMPDNEYKTTKEPWAENFRLHYILNSVQREINPVKDMSISDVSMPLRKIPSEERCSPIQNLQENISITSNFHDYTKMGTKNRKADPSISCSMDNAFSKSLVDQSVMVQMDINEEYEQKIRYLSTGLKNAEKDFKTKICAIKNQYDSNIKNILNEHNEGVKSIQNLHEETLHDVLKNHENEVENLRSMSIDAMRKVEKLEKENRLLKTRIQESSVVDEEPVKISIGEVKRRRKSRDVKALTKTDVEAFNLKPKNKSHGPCTCSPDVNLTDTIRLIFEQVDVEQRKVAEHTYMKYIANKILKENVEALDAQELSFLHLKVCRIWKLKLTKEEALQKRIDSLENEILTKRHAQQLSKLDREVVEERRRLQELRDAVCRNPEQKTRAGTPVTDEPGAFSASPSTAVGDDLICSCLSGNADQVGERRSAGDLLPSTQSNRFKRTKNESNRAVLAKLDIAEHRERKLYSDEPPTRLRKSHDRHVPRTQKK